jgi:hypothetical protein
MKTNRIFQKSREVNLENFRKHLGFDRRIPDKFHGKTYGFPEYLPVLDSFGKFSRSKSRPILEIPEVLRGPIRKSPDRNWLKLKTLVSYTVMHQSRNR